MSSSEDANAIMVTNNPAEVTTGPVGGVDNGYVEVAKFIEEFIL